MTSDHLEERLIDFAASVYNRLRAIQPSSRADYFLDQIFRASSAAVLNYAEARSAESRKDFVHKCSLVLKELRECHAALKLLPRFDLGLGSIDLQDVVKENDELICIFVKSVSTARSRLKGKI